MCRNVQITLGINLRPSLVKASTHPNFRTAPQTKNGNNFFLPTSQKIDTFIDFFLTSLVFFLRQHYFALFDKRSMHLHIFRVSFSWFSLQCRLVHSLSISNLYRLIVSSSHILSEFAPRSRHPTLLLLLLLLGAASVPRSLFPSAIRLQSSTIW